MLACDQWIVPIMNGVVLVRRPLGGGGISGWRAPGLRVVLPSRFTVTDKFGEKNQNWRVRDTGIYRRFSPQKDPGMRLRKSVWKGTKIDSSRRMFQVTSNTCSSTLNPDALLWTALRESLFGDG
jgi:hypothetical protein